MRVKIDDRMNCLSPRAKPDAEVNHTPNAEFTVESRAHLNPLFRDIALGGESHSAALDENQEDKLALSRMLQRVYILLHIVDY